MKRTKDKSGVVILAVLLGVAVVTAGLAVITHGHNRLVAQAGPDGHPYLRSSGQYSNVTTIVILPVNLWLRSDKGDTLQLTSTVPWLSCVVDYGY